MEYHENAQKNREVSLRCGEGAQSGVLGLTEISRDFILPDMYADIKRILSVNASLAPSGGYVEGGKAFFNGALSCQVLFVTDEGDVRSAPFSADYEGTVPLGTADGEYTAVFMPSVESISARSVNPRKIGIKAKINPNMYAWEAKDASVVFPETMTQADRASFEEKTEEISYGVMKHATASGIESGDDIRFDEPDAPIGEILFTDIAFSGITAEARQDAIAVSAVAEVTVAYIEGGEAGQHGALSFRHHPISLSCLLDCDGTEEGDTCIASLYCEKISCVPAENAAGEMRVAELDFTYGVQAVLEQNRFVTVVKDMYSTRYECENTESEIRISRPVGKTSASMRCVGETDFKEKGEILGVTTAARGLSLSVGELGTGEIRGSLISSVILREEDGSVVSETVEAPVLCDTGTVFRDMPECLIRPMTEQSKALLKDGKLTVTTPLSLSVMAWENRKEKVISQTAVTAECERVCGGSFTVYFPAAGEGIWEIAKKYHVPRDMLILTDADKGGRKELRRALIIPQRKKTLFSGVIS